MVIKKPYFTGDFFYGIILSIEEIRQNNYCIFSLPFHNTTSHQIRPARSPWAGFFVRNFRGIIERAIILQEAQP